MGDMVNMDEKPEQKSIVIITFQEPGSVNFGVQMDGVTPMQLIAVAWWLNKQGEAMYIQQQVQQHQQEEMHKIAVPKLAHK